MQPKFSWVDKITWKWILERKFFKLLGTPFAVDLETKNMDEFFKEQLKKKLKYWFLVPLPLVIKTFIVNSMLATSLWFSINVGGLGGGGGGSKNTWSKSLEPFCVTSYGEVVSSAQKPKFVKMMCALRVVVDLGIIDLKNVLVVSLCAWVMYAFEPKDFSLRTLFKYKLKHCFPSKHKRCGHIHPMDFCP